MREPQNLLVDARGLRQSGIGRYLREVLAVLLRDERFDRIRLAGKPEELHEFLDEVGTRPDVEIVPFPYHFYSAAAQLHWLRLAGAPAVRRRELAYLPHYDVPLGNRLRSVVMVHDLTQFLLPQFFPAWKRAVAGVVLGHAVRRAERVLVPSHATERDLAARYPAIAGKITVIPQGVRVTPSRAVPGALAARCAALRPYLLCVGSRKPHKNLSSAVEVLARLRASGHDLRLVLAGQSFGDDPVLARARELGISEAVVDAGAVSDAELEALYAHAECLLYPSLYEGFGLPPLEAMRHDVPVVASDRGSVPEAVGDAAVVVSPEDVEAMAAAVRRVLDDARYRAQLVQRGRERVRAMPWEVTARATVQVLWETAVGAIAHPRAAATVPGLQGVR